MTKVKVRRHTSYVVEHNDREFEVSHEPIDTPTIEELPNGKVIVGYLSSDSDPSSPRECENLGHMICWHRRYTLGDKHNHEGPKALWKDILGEEYEKLDQESETEFSVWYDARPPGGSEKELVNRLAESNRQLRIKVQELLVAKGYVILPLNLYDHSGITMSTGTFSHADPGGWDSGQVGYIYAGPEDIERVGCKPELVKEALEGEVREYDHFISGECYGVCVDVFDAAGEMIEDDACWGYLGNDYAKQELADEVKRHVKRHEKETV